MNLAFPKGIDPKSRISPSLYISQVCYDKLSCPRFSSFFIPCNWEAKKEKAADKVDKKRANAKAKAEKAQQPKRKPGRPKKSPTPVEPRPKTRAKRARQADAETASVEAPPVPKKSRCPKKAPKKDEPIEAKTPPRQSEQVMVPAPVPVEGSPSQKQRDERMVKALAALHELLAAMSSDPSPKDFHGPEAGFAKKILIKFITLRGRVVLCCDMYM